MGTTVSTLTERGMREQTCVDMMSMMTKQILAEERKKRDFGGGGRSAY